MGRSRTQVSIKTSRATGDDAPLSHLLHLNLPDLPPKSLSTELNTLLRWLGRSADDPFDNMPIVQITIPHCTQEFYTFTGRIEVILNILHAAHGNC